MKIFPVVLCGGIGSRLWPTSRESMPKQFQSFSFEQTLLQTTIKRLCKLNCEKPIIISNEKYLYIIQEQLSSINICPEAIILEPYSKNTTAAITLASLYLKKHYNEHNILMLTLPADHIIKNTELFIDKIKMATNLAIKKRFITFGINPEFPATGYGYIESGEEHTDIKDVQKAFIVNKFTEKPDLETAKQYIDTGNYYWNSGIFMLPNELYIQELKKYRIDDFNNIKESFDNSSLDTNQKFENKTSIIRPEKNSFIKIKNESIDYSIMENSSLISIMPISVGWSDIGSWSSIKEYGNNDDKNNVIVGNCVLLDTENSYVHSTKQLTSTVGIKNQIIIVTDDAVLVTKNDKDQNVNKLVTLIKEKNKKEATEHSIVYTSWGWYKKISEPLHSDSQTTYFQIRELALNPGHKVSEPQNSSNKNLTLTRGTVKITKINEILSLEEQDTLAIKENEYYEIENLSSSPAHIIEVSTFTSFDKYK